MIGGIPLLVFLAAAATNVATSDVPQESSFYDDETVTSDVLISDGLVKLRIESRYPLRNYMNQKYVCIFRLYIFN